MDLCSAVQFLENKTILVSGATGFLAKVFVERVLRIQPNIKRLYLLMRAADVNSAHQRLHKEVLGKELFSVLRGILGSNIDSFFHEKVIPVPGDISCENLGIQDITLRKEIWRNTNIVVNCAATTNFDERYDVALAINTMGALNVLNFAKLCPAVKMLLHVSTAYVCGEGTGHIMEEPFCMGESLNGTYKLDIDGQKKLVDEKMKELLVDGRREGIAFAMKELGMERAKFYGWPNTYVFTKAMGEMLVGHFKDNLPTVIIRPTMVTSTFKKPFPGWIEGFKTIDSVLASYGKGKLKCFLASPELVLDVIPADMVANAMIVSMVAHPYQPCDRVIYHIGSSLRNPLKFSSVRDFTTRYFTKNPWINKNGKLVKTGKVTMLSSMPTFLCYMRIRFLLPLKGLYWLDAIFCQHFKRVYMDLDRKVKVAMRLVELYKPYLLFKGIFDDKNLEKLRVAAMEMGLNVDEFGFDPKCIDWEDYFINIHLPGLVRYVMKQ
ncbi:hypothetical protein SLA2020_183850 [Shorea laevis]